jgi:hypothetical protein
VEKDESTGFVASMIIFDTRYPTDVRFIVRRWVCVARSRLQ